jgi:hypothetical protein
MVEVLAGPVDYNGELWWQIRSPDGQVGWILAGYIEQVTSTAKVEATLPATGTILPTAPLATAPSG